MALSTQQFEILRQLFETANPAQQLNFLAWVNRVIPASAPVTVATVETFLASKKEIHVCPHCGSTHIVKNGTHNGHQRFLCKDCRKSVGFSKETILFKTKKEMAVWMAFVHCMVQRFALRKCAKECRIALATAFAWRHKILDALTNMVEEMKLAGVVECDETYQLISYKGNHKKSKTFAMPRKPRKRAGKAEKRGLSKEQVCVTTGVDLSGQAVGRVSNLGKPSHKDLSFALGGRIVSGAVMVTDSHRGFCKLAGDMELSHIRIKRNRHTSGSFNIQTANNYHQGLKYMVNGIFKGVATKYLNHYVVYHSVVGFARGSEDSKEASMLDFVFTTACTSFWAKNATRPAIPCRA